MQLAEGAGCDLACMRCAQVDPIELVVWLPAVCKKMGVPYLIVKVPDVSSVTPSLACACTVLLVHTWAPDALCAASHAWPYECGFLPSWRSPLTGLLAACGDTEM